MNRFSPLHIFVALPLALLLWMAAHQLGPLVLLILTWILSRPLSSRPEGKAVSLTLLALAFFWLAYHARWVVYPIVSGAVLAHLLVPPVAWLEEHRWKRAPATVVALLPLGGLVVLAVLLFLPALVRQVHLLMDAAPQAYARLQEWIVPWLDRLGISVVLPGGQAPSGEYGPAVQPTEQLPAWLQQLTRHAETILRTAGRGLVGMGKGLSRLFQWISVAVLSPVIAYYLVVDRDRFSAGALRVLPLSWRDYALRLSRHFRDSLQVYVRGQVLVSLIEAAAFVLVFWAAGLQQPVALGLLAGLLSLIPVLGFWTTVLLVILSSLTGDAPGLTLLKAGLGLLVINLIEGQLLVPRIQGTGLRLHPLIVLLGVLFFGTLFGLAGALLAVPILGTIRAFAEDAAGSGGDRSEGSTTPEAR